MLVVDPDTAVVTHAAGDPEVWIGRSDWLINQLGNLLDSEAAAEAIQFSRTEERGAVTRLAVPSAPDPLDATVYTSGGRLIIELERAVLITTPSGLLPQLENAAAAFEHAANLQQLWNVAAQEFRKLTGFDRVMITDFVTTIPASLLRKKLPPGSTRFLTIIFRPPTFQSKPERYTCAISFGSFLTCLTVRCPLSPLGQRRSLWT